MSSPSPSSSSSNKFSLLKESVLTAITEEVILASNSNGGVLPRFELHAHINGSIPLMVLKRFAEEDAAAEEQKEGENEGKKLVEEVQCFMTPLGPEATPSERMAHCFKVFDVVYKVMQTRQRLREATRAVVRSFIEDGCVYIELRTTPKSLKDGTTDDQYISCVLEAIQDELKLHNSNKRNRRQGQQPPVRCNLILSINRRVPPEGAERVIDLAILFREKQRFLIEELLENNNEEEAVNVPTVTSIDFCGDCYARTFKEFLPALERAKSNNLKTTIHCGEKDDDEEVFQMLSFGPSRVGHCVFINDRARELIRVRQIPLEICITSNLMTGGLTKPSDHHITNWLRTSRYHPVTINTDDFSVFSTNLCKELQLFAEICIDAWIQEKTLIPSSSSSSSPPSSPTSSSLLTKSTPQQIIDAAPAVGDTQAQTLKVTFFDEVFHFVCCELWRVQYHAARCAFLMNEGDREKLLKIVDESHEKFWKSKKWL